MMGVLNPKNVVIGAAPTIKAAPLIPQKMPFPRNVRRNKRKLEFCAVLWLAICENLSCDGSSRRFNVLSIGSIRCKPAIREDILFSILVPWVCARMKRELLMNQE